MAGVQDFIEFVEDFLGPQTLTASPANSDKWDIADTSSTGTPTYTVGGVGGEATLAFDSATEIQNVCLFQNDVLNWDIDKLIHAEFRVKTVATLDTATSIAFGMATARNDAIDSIASHACFRLIGSNAILCESDDSVIDRDDIATGVSLVATYKKFVIDFQDKTDVKFYVDGVRVAASTTFDMSSFTTGMQPFVQLQKTSDNNTDSVVIDYIRIVAKR